MNGYVHSIETMGTVDGGGIRYVLFLQGCAMRCSFCHNPDTWVRKGQTVTVPEVMAELRAYRPFLELSGGGLTVSGGEPLLQSGFVYELFARARAEGFHCVLDTSGYCRFGDFKHVIGVTDRVLFSIKVVDPDKHQAITGVENRGILENLRLAAASQAELVIRYVLIPSINAGLQELGDLARLLQTLHPVPPVEILPYHRMGLEKWEHLGLENDLCDVPEPEPEDVEKARSYLAGQGIPLQ